MECVNSRSFNDVPFDIDNEPLGPSLEEQGLLLPRCPLGSSLRHCTRRVRMHAHSSSGEKKASDAPRVTARWRDGLLFVVAVLVM